MKKLIVLLSAACLFFASCSKNTTGISGPDGVNDEDRTFAETAARLYLANHSLGMMAYNNSTDSAIISLADKVIMTSNNAHLDLIEIGKMKAINVPAGIDAEHEDVKNILSSLSGSEFDSVYIHQLLKDQQSLQVAYGALEQKGNNMTLKKHGMYFSDTMHTYHRQADSLALMY